MRIEVTVAKTTSLPADATDALTAELSKRIDKRFPESASSVSVRYAECRKSSLLSLPRGEQIRSAMKICSSILPYWSTN